MGSSGPSSPEPTPDVRKVLVLGASGGVGREILKGATRRGLDVAAQTRRAERLAEFRETVRVEEGDPLDSVAVDRLVRGRDAVVSALGTRSLGGTTLFSESTLRVLEAMDRHGVRRLVAITGVGAGETRGHGGFFYDWIGFPLFTRRIYRDKERQEALIEASAVDWTLVRPAVFSERRAPGELHVLTEVGPGDVLRRVSRKEVADFVLDCLERRLHVREKPFIGHP